MSRRRTARAERAVTARGDLGASRSANREPQLCSPAPRRDGVGIHRLKPMEDVKGSSGADQSQSIIGYLRHGNRRWPARPPFRLSPGLCKLCGAQLGSRHGAFGHACDSGGFAQLRPVSLLANSVKGIMWSAAEPIHAFARRLPTVERPAARLSISRYSEFTVTPAVRLVLAKLACQAGFVISFYDLSRLVTSPPFSAARTNT
jgi:hypothetical protein